MLLRRGLRHRSVHHSAAAAAGRRQLSSAAAAAAAASRSHQPAARTDASAYEAQLPPGLLASTPSPALFVFMDKVRDNVATMLRHCGGDAGRWRPHLKTTKMTPVYAELLRAGVTKFKCATVREATVLLEAAAAEQRAGVDLLVAYPHVEPNLSRLGALAEAHPGAQLSVLIEGAEDVPAVPAALGVFVDVNIGMDRTGQPDPGEIVSASVASSETGQLRGLHFYDGHLTDPDTATRCARAHECYDRATEITNAVRDAVGTEVGEIVTSGSTSFQDALIYDWSGVEGAVAHTISPGTVVFHDARCKHFSPQLEPAATTYARRLRCKLAHGAAFGELCFCC